MGSHSETRWSLVTTAWESGAGTAPGTYPRQALEELCHLYWYPVYAHARSSGLPHQVAEELTQTLFAQILHNQRMDPTKLHSVRFRTFLLTRFQDVAANWCPPKTTEKRGHHRPYPVINTTGAKERFEAIDNTGQNPSRVFDRAWAGQVVDQALTLLAAEYAMHNTELPFEALRGLLPGGSALDRPSYEEFERRYPGVNRAALMSRVHQLKKRVPELLLAVITDTVRDPAEAQHELHYLVDILAGG